MTALETKADAEALINKEGIEYVSVRFTDLIGVQQHFTVPASEFLKDAFTDGMPFDGSSVEGFQAINESDMKLVPDVETAFVDPFRKHKTLDVAFSIVDPLTDEPYSRDPRQVAGKAEAYLKSTGIADTASFAPEAEFFIFDKVRFENGMNRSFYEVDSIEAPWNSGVDVEEDGTPNIGFKNRVKKGYFPVPPIDHTQDLRDDMVANLQKVGLILERSHHEVAGAGQQEINYRFNTLQHAGDDLMKYKYVVHETAALAGKAATFMPKPIAGDNGTGMHCHQSLWKDGKPLFFKDELVMLSIAPDEGYMLSTLSVNGNPAAVAVGDDTYTFTQPEGDVTITAAFEMRNEHTVTFDANGGSEPEELPEEVTTAMPAKKVLHGSEYYLPECEFIAPEGKQFKAWEINGTEYPVNAPVTVNADITVKALWEDAPPAHEHSYGDWSKDGTSHWHECTDDDCPNREESIKDKAAHVYTDDADTTCDVCGYERTVTPPAPTEFIVTFDAGDGTPSVGSMTTTNQKLSSLPSASRSKHSFNGWYTEKNGGTKVTTDTVFHAKTTVYAHWMYTGGGSSGYSYYTIKATAGAGGSISPSGNVSVREGRDQTFTITPDKGYAVANVKIDGKSIGAVKSYTFENVRRTHTIEVIFMKANGNPQTGVFVDVATGSYYEDAVDWAVGNGITQGTDATHFSPDGICTRAQAVTFLWRAAGSPKPETRAMPFTDIPVGSYYYDAVLWAVENDITKGTSDTTFSPNMTCTRAQIVAFLWRSEKSPAAGTANPFADVKSTAYYADAVLWAVKENITKGTTNTTFSPDADCTRAQIVTFLWRCKK